ncbi:hypothetical protein CUZ56_00218 [Saezia sanguinis]|uniref:Uncharacterized protein n=1 Tax=Saezia sanguinis TaxID=1965230 RepID=A0A433SG58_9BURK|nr:hypothetical protein [Saezia sanguinis]RUS67741.1 hypothetical protein CUZ56_00218 [Saezia sanguinis]
MSEKNQQNHSNDQTLNYLVFYTFFFALGRLSAVVRKSLLGLFTTAAKRKSRINAVCCVHDVHSDISPAMAIQYEDWLAVLIPEQVQCFREKSLAMTHHHDYINQ